MPADFTFGSVDRNRSASGVISASNPQDSYALSLSSTQALGISLTGLSADADIRLFRGASVNGNIERTEMIAESLNASFANDFINQALAPGNYIVDVIQGAPNANTAYTLGLSTDNPTNTFNVGTLNSAQSFTGTVNAGNTSDRYRFSLNSTSSLNLTLGGMSSDADLYLGRDSNNNGLIDTGEQIGSSNRAFNLDDAMRQISLSAGNYIAEVRQFSGDTHYRLGIDATPINTLSSTVDLSGSIRNVITPNIRLASDAGQAQVLVANSGTGIVNGNVRVNFYASTNQTYDSNDELLASQTANLNLGSGQSQLYNFNFGAPTGVAPGSYYLLARIDSSNAVAEFNESNNLAVQHISAPGTDVVLDWNATLLNAIQAVDTAPPIAARHQAMVHTAIFDAVNAIEQRYSSYSPNLSASLNLNATSGASTTAAAAQAAYRVLTQLYPTQRSEFDAQLARSLAEVPDGDAENRGVVVGDRVADVILINRTADGSSGAQDRYTPTGRPGSYQFTRPDSFALLPGWGNVVPFTIPNADRFVPAGPPAFGSAGYASDLNTVQRLGGLTSTARTADQSEVAVFWAYDRNDTFRPPAQWNVIAETVALRQGTSILDNARLFAHLNLAEADAGIVAWDAKYTYNQQRPISAIHGADVDGNAQTIGDPNWQSFLPTPPFPDYISGHSTFGAAAAGVLTGYFGNSYQFGVSSQEIAGTYRSFTSFQQAAAENGISRIYGGIHVPAANTDGLQVGQQVADYVLNNSLRALA
ncbi:MAG: phosphatase PAP2 family protein [Lyngbya sp. HA4199-MV5]|jgi:membrane-associated phospholipid phosphatase|nr:phosphatase PAP2 family protein [Lyngbya sp. HA4199-MV5]